MHRSLGLVLCVSVAVGGATAPMLHAHDDHDSDHHAGGAIHSHFSGHHPAVHEETEGPVVEPAGEAAVYLKLFVGAEPLAASAIAAAPHTFTLHQPAEAAPHRPVVVTHGHDPPWLDSSPPRGPPLLA